MATDWKKIKAEYIRGGISYRKLAEKYGVSFSSISRRMREEKWTDLRKQSESKANAKIVESVAEKETERINMFESIADKLLAQIDKIIEDPEVLLHVKSMRDLTGAIRDLKEIKGFKSDLDLQEQKARIDKLRKEAREESQESKDIKVIISGDLEEYAK